MIITTNKKANFEYKILEKFQAGLALPNGILVKRIRKKEITPENSFVVFQNNRFEAIGVGGSLNKLSIPLLLSKQEMKKLHNYKKEKGVTIILLNFKKSGGFIKTDIAAVKGKTHGDKRATLKERDLQRERQRGL
ncbi:MAG: SsrA-binding protein [Patescibacteria group bacterium]